MVKITPETKIAELLAEYPQLEPALEAQLPALGALQNPVLRAVVAQTTTLERAAQLSQVSAVDLVLKLRAMVGEEAGEGGDRPAWADLVAVKATVDATSMLAMGVHPIGAVREAASKLEENEAVKMNVPFRPEPLMAAMAAAGFGVYGWEESPGAHIVLIARVAGAPAPQFAGGGGGCGGGCH